MAMLRSPSPSSLYGLVDMGRSVSSVSSVTSVSSSLSSPSLLSSFSSQCLCPAMQHLALPSEPSSVVAMASASPSPTCRPRPPADSPPSIRSVRAFRCSTHNTRRASKVPSHRRRLTRSWLHCRSSRRPAPTSVCRRRISESSPQRPRGTLPIRKTIENKSSTLQDGRSICFPRRRKAGLVPWVLRVVSPA